MRPNHRAWTSSSFIFPTIYHVPSYAQWLLGTDMASAYRWHRSFLQHLQSRNPVSQWVLKSPGHIWALEAMMQQYPDALVIQTHRDPLRVIASVSSLTAPCVPSPARRRRWEAVAGEWAEYVIDGIDRSVDARESGLIPAAQIVDVQYKTFAADPIPTIAAAYDQLGLAFTADAETRMRNFLADQPAHEHGGHHYTFADTGSNEAALRAPHSARYQEYFDARDGAVLHERTPPVSDRIVSMTHYAGVVQHHKVPTAFGSCPIASGTHQRRRRCSCTAGARPADPGRAAAAVANRGWQAVTVDFRGHGESDWAQDGDYRVTASPPTSPSAQHLPPRPALVEPRWAA